MTALVVAAVLTVVAGLQIPGLIGVRSSRVTAVGAPVVVLSLPLVWLLVLGPFGKFSGDWVLAGSAALAVVCTALTAWRPDFLTGLSGLGGAIGRACADCVRVPTTLVLIALVFGQTLWRTWVAYRLPIGDADGNGYHVVIAAIWAQTGRFVRPNMQVYTEVYPAASEAISAWTMIFLRSDALADAAQIPFGLLGLVAVAVAARTLGVRPAMCIAAGCVTFLTPVALAQMNSGYVDVAGASTAIAVCTLMFIVGQNLVRSHTESIVADVAMLGMAAGFAAAVKSSNLLIAIFVLLALTLGLGAIHARHEISGHRLRVASGAGLLPMLGLGGVWYAQNIERYGNPFHPFDFGFGPFILRRGIGSAAEIFDFATPNRLRSLPQPVRPFASWFWEPLRYDPEVRIGGLGITWAWILLPALALFGLQLVRRKRWRLYAVTFVVPLLGLALAQPALWWSRYTLVLVAPGAIALYLLLAQTRAAWIRPLISTLTVVAVGVGVFFATVRPLLWTSRMNFTAYERLLNAPASERSLGKTVRAYEWLEDTESQRGRGLRLLVLKDALYLTHPLVGQRLRNQVRVVPATLDTAKAADAARAQQSDYVLTGPTSQLRAQLAAKSIEPVRDEGFFAIYAASDVERAAVVAAPVANAKDGAADSGDGVADSGDADLGDRGVGSGDADLGDRGVGSGEPGSVDPLQTASASIR